MIIAENLSYSFPSKDLYNQISFTLEEGQHCAFIGTSGSGKSTLLNIIMNPDQFMYDGKLKIAQGLRTSYVSQFQKLDDANELTVFEYIAQDYIKLQNDITSICTEMETSTDIDSLMEKYQQALDAFSAIGGDDFESNLSKKLSLANLIKHENQLVTKLSSGEFKLIQVIKEMLNSPDLLIMDEPDVFLDFENLIALKDLINSHKGMLLIITHNRYLLNHCFNKIIHLENTELQEFDGNFRDYNFSLLQRKIELQELAVADTLEIERNELLINKLRATASTYTDASRGKSLNARVKIKERLEARRIKAPFVDIKQPEIHFGANRQEEETIALKVSDYSLSFQDILLENVNLEMKSTDKVALVGANGTGKTTLLREIFQNKHESIWIHPDMEVAFLSQAPGETLQESNTVKEEFLQAGFKTYGEIISHLANFGFLEEIMNQKIDALSGGEKNLLQLAKISASNANLLLLDEPTSHLDTYSQMALEKAINDYKGAILMISHDFYTIVNCMDYVFLLEDKTLRKVSMRKFRKMIYGNHFDKDYLEMEQKKKEIETKIEFALKDTNFALAKVLSEDLETMLK